MAVDITAIVSALESHAGATGRFDAVNLHEPKRKPAQRGITAAIWPEEMFPADNRSGLDSTTVRLVFTVRLYTNMLQKPEDLIDQRLIQALDVLFAAYSSDFTLDGAVASVDLLGETGRALSFTAGYLEQDDTLFRVLDIYLPLIVNDAYSQEP